MMQERIMEEKSKVMEMMNAAMEMTEKCPRCNNKFGGGADDLMGSSNEIRNSEVIVSRNSLVGPPDSGFGADFSIKGKDGLAL